MVAKFSLYKMPYVKTYPLLLILALILQITFWAYTKSIKPDLAIVPELPSEAEVKALSLGDRQFYYRYLGYVIQNAGDTYGRSTPLKDYNYEKLSKWFYLLDEMDKKADYVPALAAYYYSSTQNKEDTRYIVNYLAYHSEHDLEKNWWWLVQAVFIARHRLDDKPLALKIAYKLSKLNNVPFWAKQMPAFIHLELGEKKEAIAIIQSILNSYQNIPERELNFMYYFVNERVKKYVAEEKEAQKKLRQ